MLLRIKYNQTGFTLHPYLPEIEKGETVEILESYSGVKLTEKMFFDEDIYLFRVDILHVAGHQIYENHSYITMGFRTLDHALEELYDNGHYMKIDGRSCINSIQHYKYDGKLNFIAEYTLKIKEIAYARNYTDASETYIFKFVAKNHYPFKWPRESKIEFKLKRSAYLLMKHQGLEIFSDNFKKALL